MSRLGSTAAEHLSALGTVAIEPGLSEAELAGIEAEFGFAFAEDHRAFLAAGLPVGGTWPHWRGEGRRSLATWLQLPVDGILFAVEWHDFWDDGWGARPARMRDALRTAKYRLDRVPRMIPLCSHHYLPAAAPGHPCCRSIRPTSASTLPTCSTTSIRGSDGPTRRRRWRSGRTTSADLSVCAGRPEPWSNASA